MNLSERIQTIWRNKKKNIAFILCLALVAVTIGGSLTSFAGDSNNVDTSSSESGNIVTTNSAVATSDSGLYNDKDKDDAATKNDSVTKDEANEAAEETTKSKTDVIDEKTSSNKNKVGAQEDEADFLSRFSVDEKGTITGFEVGMGAGRYNDTKLVIPDTIDKVQITAIGKNAFLELSTSDVTEVVIPNNVTSIGQSAFDGAKKLKTVNIPSGVTSLGMRAFANTGLQFVTIPGGVKEIPSQAFYNCTSLIMVTMNSGTETIGGNAFSSDSKLAIVIVPDTIKKIEGWAFSYCSSLQNFTFPKSLESIGTRSFDNTRLKAIDLSSTKVETIGQWCFNKNLFVRDVKFPSTLTQIDQNAFEGSLNNYYNDKLVITIPQSVKAIGANAFLGMAKGELDLRAHLEGSIAGSGWGVNDTTKIVWKERSNSCFYIDEKGVITGLKPADHSDNKCANPTFHSDKRNLVIPAKVQTSDGAIDITGVGDSAFQNDQSLLSVKFEDNVNMTKIGKDAFKNCKKLTSIIMNDNITTIDESCFMDCSALEDIRWSQNLKNIGTWAFHTTTVKNNKITKLDLPASLEEIGNGAFIGLNPTEISFKEGLKKIGFQAFSGTSKVTEITIPSTVENIDTYAFELTNLKTVYIKGSNPLKINSSSFKEVSSLENIYITGRAIDSVKDSAWGAQYATIHWADNKITPAEVITSADGDWTINRKKGTLISYNGDYKDSHGEILDPFVVPRTIKDSHGQEHNISLILSQSFKGNGVELGEFKISEGIGLDTLAVNVFGGVKVKELTLPSSVISVPFFAFQNIGLEKVNFSKSLRTIGNQAFAGNNLQGTLTLPGKMTNIVADAFINNPGITAVYIDAYKKDVADSLLKTAMFGTTNAQLFYIGDVPETSIVSVNPDNRARAVVFYSSMLKINQNFSGFYPDGQPKKDLTGDYLYKPEIKASTPYSYYENGTYTVMAKNKYGSFPYTFQINDIGLMEINATDTAFSVTNAGKISETQVVNEAKTTASDLDSGATQESSKLSLNIAGSDMTKVNAMKEAGETTTVSIKATYKDTYPDEATDAKGKSLKGKEYVNTTETTINVSLIPEPAKEPGGTDEKPDGTDEKPGDTDKNVSTDDPGNNDNGQLAGGKTAKPETNSGSSSNGAHGDTEASNTAPTPKQQASTNQVAKDQIQENQIPSIGIGDDSVPLYGNDTWALVNLLLAVVGAILALMAVVRTIVRKKYEEQKPLLMISTIVAALVGILLFIFTQDMNLAMALVDEWTILNGLLIVAEVVMIVFAFRTMKDEEDVELEYQ